MQKVRMKMAEVVGAGEGLWYRNLLSYISPSPLLLYNSTFK